MTRDLITAASDALPQLIGLALVAWGLRALSQWLKDRRVALAMELLAVQAASIVADIAQHFVGDLRDPAKPGAWDATAKATARVRAVERLKGSFPAMVALVREALKEPGQIDDVLGGLVEKAVVDLKGKGPTVSAATGSGDVTVNVEAEIPAPVDSNTQLGAVDVRTLVAVALALVVAAVGCPASRQLTRPALGAVDGCEPRATRCSPDGRPQVCSGSRRWTDADGVCTHGVNVAAVCCLTTSPVTGNALHACVLAERCTADAGAP